jgi:AcrR family transcriptional regulator
MTEELPSRKSTAPHRGGRPLQLSDAARRAEVLKAAEHVFVRHGYYAAKMDDITERSGMSKKTIYRLFESKEALFDALLVDRFAVLSLPVKEDPREPAAALETIMLQLALFVLSQRQIKLLRLLIAEAPRSPETVRAFERLGLGAGKGTLEQWFAVQAERGVLPIKDPLKAASMLFNLAVGDMYLSLLMRLGRQPTRAQITVRVREAIDIFMAGLATGHI